MSYAIWFVLLLIPIGIALFVVFDLIVRLEYKRHRNVWETDQCPVGFFWRPRKARVWAGSLSRSKLASEWLYSTPEWIASDPAAQNLLFLYRVLWGLSILGWLVMVMFAFVNRRSA
jgi:uncharacterized membrane protein YesL